MNLFLKFKEKATAMKNVVTKVRGKKEEKGLPKTLFYQTSKKNNENFDKLRIIDTTYIQLPEYRELSQAEKDMVKYFEKELQVEKWEELMTYGNVLLGYSNGNVDVLLKLLGKITERPIEWQMRYLSLSELSEKRVNNMIDIAELQICQNGLNELKKVAVLKAIALKRKMQREDLRKYDFLGVFRNAERMRYAMYKNSLKESYERLLIAIKTIEQQLVAVEDTLFASGKLDDSLAIYNRVIRRFRR